MSLTETFRDAIDALAAHKVRAGLSMLGMVFGVGAVIAMLAIGAGAESQTLAMIERLGLRNIVIQTKELDRADLREIREKSPGLNPRDLVAIPEAVPGVEWVTPRVKIEPYQVVATDGKIDGMVYGVSRHFFEDGGVRIVEGRSLDRYDEETHAQVCVIDDRVRRNLFGHRAALGEPLKVNDVWLTVVGVLGPETGHEGSAQPTRLGSTAGRIYLPFTSALRKFDHPLLDSPFDQIIVRVTPGTSPWQTTAILDPLLNLLHGGERDYTLVVPEALLAESRRTQKMFNLVMGCIAGISLLVGGIGIMNIMLASVLERTREIGVRRAVGARRRDIRWQFLMESFSISLLGGIVGVAVGLVIAYGVAVSAGWPTRITLWSILLSTGVSITVGVVSGLYPANRAARLDPARALSYE